MSALDLFFMGRKAPSPRSTCCLLGIAICGGLYAHSKWAANGSPRPSAHLIFWCSSWIISFAADSLYIKYIFNKFDVSGLDATLLQNGYSLCWLGIYTSLQWLGQQDQFKAIGSSGTEVLINPVAGFVIASSCLAGTLISYSSLNLRSLVSTTSFAVIGVASKMLSILLNEYVFHEEHGHIDRLLIILLCVVLSALYQQAPPRKMKTVTASMPDSSPWLQNSAMN